MFSSKYNQFLTYEDFETFKFDYKLFNLIQTETYNERSLSESITKIGKEICGAIAIQLAVVGYGNRNFGKVRFNEVEIDIGSFFKKNNIKSDLVVNSKLLPEDVTPRRLIRFFRYLINDYIKRNPNCQTYLFRKYCLNKNDNTRIFIFPGFEHMAEPETDIKNVRELLNTYRYLDHKLNTKIYDRIIRVLIARGFNNEILLLDHTNDLV